MRRDGSVGAGTLLIRASSNTRFQDASRAGKTVNGVEGRGGSIDGPGPAIAGGMLFANSGYVSAGGMPGNVLLAFTVDGK